jgi:hypothetical protein
MADAHTNILTLVCKIMSTYFAMPKPVSERGLSRDELKDRLFGMEYDLYRMMGRFLKRMQFSQDKTNGSYSALDKLDGHTFLSQYGEGILVTYGKNRPEGRPRIEPLRPKGTHFPDITRFSFELFQIYRDEFHLLHDVTKRG